MTSAYDLPDEIEVESAGPVRLVTLNRPDKLNATNHLLHKGLAHLFTQLDADLDARVAVITGKGRAFSAGGDYSYLDELSRDDELRRETMVDARQLVLSMVACRIPLIAAVNGPAVGLGCSVVALSDIVYMAESAHLADPHALVGLVAADGGAVTWPLLISLQLAKEYALTGDRISSARAAQIGLANHVVPDADLMDEALACANRVAALPRQTCEDTKRALNMHLERAVLNVIDFALTAEERSFTSSEFRANIGRLVGRNEDPA
jgi:enoyl-CoA hydratase/carnithine racemase